MSGHGGNISEVALQYGLKPEQIIDFSSNINPLGIPSRLKKSFKKSICLLDSYPDNSYRELKYLLSIYSNVESKNILAGNGAVNIIYNYMFTLKPSRALVVAPTFSEYAKALHQVDANVDYFALKEKNNFEIDFDELYKKLKKNYDLFVICNPNNPTGKFLRRDKIEKIVSCLKDSKTEIFIDESFIEFTSEGLKESAACMGNKYKNLFVLRSCTKYLAIPGLRVGYAVSTNNRLIEKIESLQVPWQINSLANCAAKFLAEDFSFKRKTEKLIRVEREKILSSFKKINWINPYMSEVNFVLCKINEQYSAEKLKKELLKKNILIRNAGNFKFLNNKYIRLAIKNSKSNKRLISALYSL